MKIKDIVIESLYDWQANLRKQAAQASWNKTGAKEFYANQNAARNKKWAAAQAAKATQATVQPAAEPTSKLGTGWTDTSLGISIKPATQTAPTLAYYQKKYYILNNIGQWLTSNKRPVPDTLSAVLNQALEQT